MLTLKLKYVELIDEFRFDVKNNKLIMLNRIKLDQIFTVK